MMQPYGFRQSTQSVKHKKYTMTIRGEGSVTARPDEAVLVVGIVTEHMELQHAQQENSRKSNQILTAMKKLGIAEQELQTTNYVVTPIYDYPEGKAVFRGYQVEHLIQVTVRDLLRIGSIYQAAIENGANRTENLQFRLSNPDIYALNALNNAVQNANIKARELAQAIGVTFNPIPINMIEERNQQFQPFQQSFAFSSQSNVPPIQTGNMTISSAIKVIYEYST